MSIRSEFVSSESMPDQFDQLVRLLPPRVIREEGDYDRVIAFMDHLLARPELNRDQLDFFDTWSVLIAAYEAEHHPLHVVDGP